MKKTKRKFGSWASPITAEMVTTAGVRLGDVAYCEGCAFWAETRPTDAGRCTIVKVTINEAGETSATDLIKAPFNVRTRVHEYGGGAWWVNDDSLFFVNWDDQRLYKVSHHVGDSDSEPNKPIALTEEPSVAQALRYADGCVSEDKQWIVCVRERHVENALHPHNELVAISASGEEEHTNKVLVLASGEDFYSTPRLSADGKRLCWIQWSHPQMPWDGTQLMVGEINGFQELANVKQIAGANDISIMGALWSDADELLYASDESGWWNLYSVAGDELPRQLTRFTDREVGTPAWIFGTQRFVLLDQEQKSQRFALIVTHNARDELMLLDDSGELISMALGYTSISSIAAANNGELVVHGQANTEQASIALIRTDAQSEKVGASESAHTPIHLLRVPENLGIGNTWLSEAQPIVFMSSGEQTHAFYYPPTGHNLSGEADELPPLVVMGHGGPTSHATTGLKLSIQYWTSRGIAVVDVNYGGSSGYGRDYRRRLQGQWSVVDVQDCIAAANYLADQQLADSKRMVIRGGSAGGLTVLRALQTSNDFAAGASFYGVADLELLAGDTHKFESRYLDGLLGGEYTQHKAVYQERSPINHTDKLNCPILVMQGDEDKVVPPNQSEAIVNAAAKKGLPHAYILFEGEQHGFRKSENVIRALQIELWFYSKVLGFDTAETIQAPVEAVGL